MGKYINPMDPQGIGNRLEWGNNDGHWQWKQLAKHKKQTHVRFSRCFCPCFFCPERVILCFTWISSIEALFSVSVILPNSLIMSCTFCQKCKWDVIFCHDVWIPDNGSQ